VGHWTLSGWSAGMGVRPGSGPDVAVADRAHADGVEFTSQPEGNEHIMEKIHAAFRNEGLVRSRDGRVLGGVCAALGRRLGIDPWPARLLFVLALLVLPGSQFLVYPILWILMPAETVASSTPASYPPASAGS
jgi:phage shock protein C